VAEPPETFNPARTGSGVEAWADYAKDRFDFWADRVNEIRNRARQLAAALGVVIGLELTLLGRFALESTPTHGRCLFLACLAILFVAFGLQLLLLPRLLKIGYGSDKILGGPESPADKALKADLWNKDEKQAKNTLGLYYADTADDLFNLSERLTNEMRADLRWFLITLGLLFLGCLALVLRAVV
jgi:hypothetical protein